MESLLACSLWVCSLLLWWCLVSSLGSGWAVEPLLRRGLRLVWALASVLMRRVVGSFASWGN
ncbi:hypothetical protein M501DRAFT_1004434 [Patellaria atrata CBS 101060]|uniref:Uncharacterized protein n=1 Tax=Patellaria atrata CBS 101060 TaxID=1346257 RepID=A0A9P4VPB8_9PEZI|nr:hypothetical protein M501DRAFT_1004434 [Patellaria atrata CBS 101060]